MLNHLTALAGRVLIVIRMIPLAAVLAIHQLIGNP